MGEIAEAMLDGTLCSCCGEYLGSDAGFPIYCAGCGPSFPDAEYHGGGRVKQPPRRARYPREVKIAKPYSCQIDGCGKRFATKAGKGQHRRQKHGAVR